MARIESLQRTASIRELICKEIGCEIGRLSTLASGRAEGGLGNTVRASEAAKAELGSLLWRAAGDAQRPQIVELGRN